MKETFRHISIYTLPAVIAKAMAILMVPVYTFYLPPEEYGALELIFSICALSVSMVSFGWDSALTRFLSDSNSEKDPGVWMSSVLCIRVAGYLLLFLVYYFYLDEIGALVQLPSQYFWLIWIALVVFLINDSIKAVQLVFRARQQSASYAKLTVIRDLTRNIVVVFALVFFGSAISAVLNGYMVAGIVVLLLTRMQNENLSSLKPPNSGFIVEALKYGGPLMPSAVALTITNWSDRIMLSSFLPQGEALYSLGLYSFAVKVATVPSMILIGFKVWWGPYVYNSYDRSNVRKYFGMILDFYALIIAILSLFVIVFASEALTYLVSKKYLDAVPFVGGLVIAQAIYTYTDYSSIGIGISKATYLRAFGGIGLAIINIILNLALIPAFGVSGAIWATVLSYAAFGTYTQFVSQKRYEVPINYVRIAFLTSSLFLALLFDDASLEIKLIGLISFFVLTAMVFCKRLLNLYCLFRTECKGEIVCGK